jgi:hypothetical protein
MSAKAGELWGLMAVFEEPEQLVEAVKRARAAGYRKLDAYSPFPIDEVEEAMEIGHTGVAAICWVAGLVGATSGFALMTYDTVYSYPLNVGGRPYFSWPAYVPITFELMVLFAGVFTFLGVLGLNRLPRYYHPVFNVAEFQQRNSSDGFFLVIEASDRSYRRDETRELLLSLNPSRIYEVPDAP